MAAVLCLVMLPLMCACGFMFGVLRTELTGANVLCALTFFLMGAGMLVGMFRMSRGWEDEEPR